jgi:uncharacterized protein
MTTQMIFSYKFLINYKMFKINRLNLLFALLVVFFQISCKTKVQQTTPSVSKASATPATIEDKKSLLWEISGKDLKKPSYLYGTIHLIPKADFFLTDATKKVFDASQKVTFEINMKDMNNPMAMMGMMSKAMMPNGKKLKDFLSADDYGLVKRKFDSLGLPLQMLERIKPMFLSVMVGNDGEKMSLDGSSNENNKSTSYEMEFLQMGEKQKKEFGGLETVEFQMGIFDSIPYKAQAEMLVKTIKGEGSDSNDEFNKMVKMYKSQDIEAMSQMLGSSDETDLAKYEGMLITTRNRNWIPIMRKMMLEKSTFFAVGAGHLGGEKGVVNLLRQEGYKVKSLKGI